MCVKKIQCFFLLLLFFAACYSVFAQPDANPPLSAGQTLAGSIMSNLIHLKSEIMQLENELLLSNSKYSELDQLLANSERLVNALSMLVEDQLELYRKSLSKWKSLSFGLIGLLIAYFTLKAFLWIKFKIRIW